MRVETRPGRHISALASLRRRPSTVLGFGFRR